MAGNGLKTPPGVNKFGMPSFLPGPPNPLKHPGNPLDPGGLFGGDGKPQWQKSIIPTGPRDGSHGLGVHNMENSNDPYANPTGPGGAILPPQASAQGGPLQNALMQRMGGPPAMHPNIAPGGSMAQFGGMRQPMGQPMQQPQMLPPTPMGGPPGVGQAQQIGAPQVNQIPLWMRNG